MAASSCLGHLYVGTDEYCQSITAKRAAKIQSSLDVIGELTDPQVVLALLRSCASFGKMVSQVI